VVDSDAPGVVVHWEEVGVRGIQLEVESAEKMGWAPSMGGLIQRACTRCVVAPALSLLQL